MFHSTLLSRRLAMAAGFALPHAAQAAEAPDPQDAPALLLQRARQANAAFMRGDMAVWHRLASPIAADFTLMQPFGGAPSRGFDASSSHLEQLARYFRNGDGVSELVQTYACTDMVVLVMIERQHGEVGGLPDQEWSLRVTQIYRRRDGEWQFVHRHADPLVRNIGLERSAALARG